MQCIMNGMADAAAGTRGKAYTLKQAKRDGFCCGIHEKKQQQGPHPNKQGKVPLQKIPDDADAQTAKLDTAFGVLLVVSLVLERLI